MTHDSFFILVFHSLYSAKSSYSTNFPTSKLFLGTQVKCKAKSKTVRNIKSAWVKEMRATVDGNAVTQFQVNLQLTFMLDGNS